MFKYSSIDIEGDVGKQILSALKRGAVRSFGSDRDVDKHLQALRKAGTIRYRKAKDGGAGWELVAR